jgi:hypothetical protein
MGCCNNLPYLKITLQANSWWFGNNFSRIISLGFFNYNIIGLKILRVLKNTREEIHLYKKNLYYIKIFD